MDRKCERTNCHANSSRDSHRILEKWLKGATCPGILRIYNMKICGSHSLARSRRTFNKKSLMNTQSVAFDETSCIIVEVERARERASEREKRDEREERESKRSQIQHHEHSKKKHRRPNECTCAMTFRAYSTSKKSTS